MSERAYSIELKRNISAKEAVELSEEAKLLNERNFQCCDKKCRINLTCTNWKNKHGKRFYFVPSHNDELHVIGCDEVEKKVEREQIKKEIRDIALEIKSNGIITMMVSPDKNTKEAEERRVSEKEMSKTNGFTYTSDTIYQDTKSEGKRASRIDSFVELFNREGIDKDKKIILVKNKLFSLNDLFVPSDRKPIDGIFGIFYGLSSINICTFNENMVEITFLNSKFPKIYTNIESLNKITNGCKMKNLINKDKYIMTYFRGSYNNSKFHSYNDKYYKDLYFEINMYNN